MEPSNLNIIISRYLNGTASKDEQDQVEKWYSEQMGHQDQWPLSGAQETSQVKEAIWQKLSGYVAMQQGLNNVEQPEKQTSPTSKTRFNRRWIRSAVAATIIVLLGSGMYIWLNGIKKGNLVSPHSYYKLKEDIPPGHSGALLTLADGRVLCLDSVSSDLSTSLAAGAVTIALQGSQRIDLSQNSLIYQSAKKDFEPKQRLYNRLVTPKGRQYKVTLSDGTQVWLNADSKLTYPTTFADNQRKVEISGEAYFEVAKDRSRPFIVQAGSVAVKVLGTHFNVNNYATNDAVKTTLLSGSVLISNGQRSERMQPGWQAIIKNNTTAIALREVNTEGAVAWKNGYFYFDHDDLQGFMQQMARWYDLEVDIDEDLPEQYFSGEIERNQPFSNVIDYLKNSGVHVHVQQRTVTIKK